MHQTCFENESRYEQNQAESLKELHSDTNKKLVGYSKPSLVLHQKELFDKAVEETEKLVLEGTQPVSRHILNELVPTYEKRSFTLAAYSELRKHKEPVYTKPFRTRNLEWRLKIYPNGSENSEDMYISIYVELFSVDGPTLPQECIGKYKYQVEVKHPTIADKSISRELESEFEPGECWGYTTYAKLADLYQEGYLGDSDTLEVVLHIKASSFYYEVVDLDRMLFNKKKQYEANRERLIKLKEQLNIEIETEQSQQPEQPE